ncbi:hypothetical protein M407DRAFT_5485 [Tulasnella calospora MUT 4182]|uniref:Uncharacterized protein n=1 Tax=Tulasnella calospora MUT 4182 TaxID=1051891 RepID=A0A0C3QGG5_9AGAM|nr:hypothetical protein M407DRAFT_5485 [Tulasnella calospora MUT 4182]
MKTLAASVTTALLAAFSFAAASPIVASRYGAPGLLSRLSGSSGPLGLWGSGPTTDGCPGYSYLNVHPKGTYSTLSWDAVSTTKWNATVNTDLTKLGFPTTSTFLACRRPNTTSKKGPYVLLLEGCNSKVNEIVSPLHFPPNHELAFETPIVTLASEAFLPELPAESTFGMAQELRARPGCLVHQEKLGGLVQMI